MKSTLYVAVIAVLLAFVACQSPQSQTPVPTAEMRPPQANRLRVEAISSDAVQLDWPEETPTETPEETNASFQIERQSASLGIESVAVVEGSSYTYTDTGLMAGGTYTYRLTQIGAGAAITLESKPVTVPESDATQGNLLAKAVSSVTLKPSKPPTVLTWQRTTFTATTVGDSTNRVRWEKPAGTLSITNNKAVFSSSKEGTFTVTAISLANSSKRASANIKVQKGILYGISLTAAPNPINLGNASTITVGFDGRGSYGTGINFQVSPNTGSINSVGNNRYEFRAAVPGAYTIKATSSFNPIKTASISVNVNPATTDPTISSLQLTANPSSVDLNQASSLSLTFTGTDAFGRGVTWTVSPAGTVTEIGRASCRERVCYAV